jgi:hypothetical protein
MKDLFLCLLINLKSFGKTLSASLYGNELSSIKVERDGFEYDITITCKEIIKEEEKDA